MPTPVFGVNRLVVRTISPVHIGIGVRLGTFDLWRDGDQVSVLDQDKVLAWAASQGGERRLEALTQLIEQKRSLAQYLQQRGAARTQVEAYQLRADTSQNIRELMPFIRSYTQKAYLPGSSLKGSLRSSLQRGQLLVDAARRQRLDDMVGAAAHQRRSASEQAQADSFVPARTRVERGAVPNYGLNRLLSLGDSTPILGPLEAVEVKVYSVDQNNRLQPKTFSQFAEVLPVGTGTSLPVTWNTYLLGELASELEFSHGQALMLFLPEYCRAASRSLLVQEIRFYQTNNQSDLAKWYEQRLAELDARTPDIFFLPLGWGSGYDAKTITDLFSRATFEVAADKLPGIEGLERPGNRHANPWLGPELSPKSRKLVVRSNGELEPMGWVALAFRTRHGENDDWLADARQTHQDQRPQFALDMTAEVAPVPTPPPTVMAVISPELPPAAETPAPPPLPPEPEITPETQAPTPAPPSPAPVAPPVPVARPPAAPKPPLVLSFAALPASGSRFRGTVLSTESDGTIFLELPGLSADDLALGMVSPENNPERRKYREGAVITCEVLTVKPDSAQTGYWLVMCARE